MSCVRIAQRTMCFPTLVGWQCYVAGGVGFRCVCFCEWCLWRVWLCWLEVLAKLSITYYTRRISIHRSVALAASLQARDVSKQAVHVVDMRNAQMWSVYRHNRQTERERQREFWGGHEMIVKSLSQCYFLKNNPFLNHIQLLIKFSVTSLSVYFRSNL